MILKHAAIRSPTYKMYFGFLTTDKRQSRSTYSYIYYFVCTEEVFWVLWRRNGRAHCPTDRHPTSARSVALSAKVSHASRGRKGVYGVFTCVRMKETVPMVFLLKKQWKNALTAARDLSNAGKTKRGRGGCGSSGEISRTGMPREDRSCTYIQGKQTQRHRYGSSNSSSSSSSSKSYSSSSSRQPVRGSTGREVGD